MYDAFISYRHAEADIFVAENLHKKLEAFKLPKSIVKQRGKNTKKRIERVFRDRDELPLAANLADPIMHALEHSEFLIVICSPRLPLSLWCKKEIETFISMHGREKVLAVLIEGEPDAAFPEELLYRNREIRHEDGTVEIIKEAVEPLAADVRGTSKKEILKKMDEELLRLAAVMFDCDYDDLKQRHKEQKMKKLLTVSLLTSAVFFTFGAISTTMAVQIRTQNKQIQEQANEIQVQKEKIEVQYQQALYNQSLSLAEKSLDLLEEGDRMEAVKVALSAFSKADDGIAMPVTAQAQYALSKSSYVYQNAESWIPAYMLKHEANIEMMSVSPDGMRLLTADRYGNIYIWDVLTNKILARIEGSYFSYARETNCFFISDERILYEGEDGLEVYDLDKKQVILSGIEDFSHGKADTDCGVFAVVTDDLYSAELRIYDADDLSLLQTYKVPEGMIIHEELAFDNEGKKIAFVIGPDVLNPDGGDPVLSVLDIETGNISGQRKLEYSDYGNLQIEDQILYVGVSQDIDEAFPDGDISLFTPYKSIMYAIDLNDMGILWEHRYDAGAIDDFKINAGAFSRHIMVSYYSEAQLLDMDTGDLLYEYAYGDEVVSILYYKTDDIFILMLRDGEYHLISGKNGSDVVYRGYFQANSENIKNMYPVANGFVTLPYTESNVTYYEMSRGMDYELRLEENADVFDMYVNDEESRILLIVDGDRGKRIILKDMQTNEIICEWNDIDNKVKTQGFAGKDGEYIYTFDNECLKLYKASDGSLQKEYSFEDTLYPDYVSVGSDDNSLIFHKSYQFIRLNLADGTTEYIRLEHDAGDELKTAVSTDFKTYAVADKKAHAITFTHTGDEKSYMQIEAIASLVEQMVFTEDNKYLFVYYMDDSIAVYDTQSGSCIKEIEKFGDAAEYGVSSYKNGYAVSVLGGKYLLDEKFEITALFPGGAVLLENSEKFLVADNRSVFSCPVYTAEELVKKAEEILTCYQ